MKQLLMSAILILLWLPLAHVHAAHDEAADKAYIRQAESDWAEQLVTNDVSVLQRVLADDFVSVSPAGKPVFQRDAIAETRNPSLYVSDHLADIEIRFFGDVAIAQGSSQWTN